MIFRRVKAHIEKENWFAVGVDFFIVMVGFRKRLIFCFLAATNYSHQ